MADKISKIILSYSVQGDTAAQAGLTRTASLLRTTKSAADELQETLTGIRVEAQSEALGAQYGTMARDINKADEAAKSLAEELAKIGASKGDIEAAGRAFESFRTDDGSTGGASAITKFGSKLRSLPSVQIPGAGIGTDAIANLTRLLGTLPPAILPIIALLGGVTAAFVLLGKSLEGAKAQLDAAIAAQNKYFQQLQDLNTKQAQAEIDRLKIRNELIQKQVENEIKVVQIGKDSVVDSFSGLFDAVGILFGKTREDIVKELAAGGVNKDITDNLDKLKKEFDENTSSIGLLENGLKDGAFAVNDMAEALKKFTDQVTNETIASIAENANVHQEINHLVAEGTEKELEAKKKELEATQKNAEEQLKGLKANIDAAQKGSDAQKAFQAEFDKQSTIYGNVTYELSQLNQAFVDTAVKANDAAEELKQANENAVKVVEKYNADIENETIRDNEKLAEIDKKFQDDLIKAAETLADAGEKALQSLKDKQADLITSLGRGELTAAQKAQQQQLEQQIKFQEVEAKSARDHARRLRDIQEQAQQEQEDAIANRDFSALFKSRRNVSQSIQNENRDFQEQEAERQAEFAQKQEADQRQFDFERAQRAQAFAFANQDALKQYDRQNKLAEANYQKSLVAAAKADSDALRLEAQKHRNTLDQLLASAQNEISIIRQTSDIKKQIFETELQQAQTILNAMQGGVSGIGSAGAFGGSRALGFAGVGSSINNNNGGNTVNNAFNLSGAGVTVQQIASVVSQVLHGYLN